MGKGRERSEGVSGNVIMNNDLPIKTNSFSKESKKQNTKLKNLEYCEQAAACIFIFNHFLCRFFRTSWAA